MGRGRRSKERRSLLSCLFVFDWVEERRAREGKGGEEQDRSERFSDLPPFFAAIQTPLSLFRSFFLFSPSLESFQSFQEEAEPTLFVCPLSRQEEDEETEVANSPIHRGLLSRVQEEDRKKEKTSFLFLSRQQEKGDVS